MKENHEVIEYMVVGDDDNFEENVQAADLAPAQELAATNVNPMKLVTLLRVRFGIGRYEISASLVKQCEKRHALIVYRENETYIIFEPRDVFR